MESSVVLSADSGRVTLALTGGYKLREDSEGTLVPYVEMSPDEAFAVMEANYKMLLIALGRA